MNRAALRRLLGCLVSGTALLACGDPVGPTDEITCTPPAIPGCALVEGRVLAHDSTAAGNVYVTVDPAASDTVFDGGFAQTESDGGFRVKVLPFYGYLPDWAQARIVAFRPRSSGPVTQADTAHAVLPFAEHGEHPVAVTVHLRLPAPADP